MSPEVEAPLRRWRFGGRLRHYQADALDRVDVDAPGPLHIVAPPGSGKTLLGLLLAMRRGSRTLVLAPTITIRDQWATEARRLAPDDASTSDASTGDEVSTTSDAPGELTALTYQSLSVLDGENPLAALAHDRWLRELETDGRSTDAASAWLDALRSDNRRAYAAGIARRSRTMRRRIAQEDPDALSRALHPNARALIERLVDHGVDTVVLDECHHLLDHWALVVSALVSRLRAAGRSPLVIGLTATLPSPDDGNAYDNYTSLLGDVDYEVPIPAVVREGNLAPYRELVRFVEPTADELAFLSGAATGLGVLIRSTFAHGDGAEHLVRMLQPPTDVAGDTAPDGEDRSGDVALAPPAAPPASGTAPAANTDIDIRLSRAFADDFAGAESAAAMLATVHPDHPLVDLLPIAAQRTPTTEESLRLLGRFALDRILPDPSARERWARMRATLADFGFSLTDRGLRRTRDPIDTMLASSLSKDRAVCDILRLERDRVGPRLRALVVSDFSEHGNRHGGLIGRAGALRTFDVLATDAATADLRCILVTGSTTRIATRRVEPLTAAWSAALGIEVTAVASAENPAVSEISAPGVGAAGFVRAASLLLERGDIEVIVGTRGLFGEGWDCPAVNTLVDLSSVATAPATQQLRGRALRLDPAWPEKVAHIWTVTALLPPESPIDAAPDLSRLRRKHERLWGVHRDDPERIVRGLSGLLTTEQRRLLVSDARPSAEDLDALTVVEPREHTRALWRIGEDYLDRESTDATVVRRVDEPTFRTRGRADAALGAGTAAAGIIATAALALVVAGAVGAAGPAGLVAGVAALIGALTMGVPVARAWWRARRAHADAPELYGRVAGTVVAALRRSGRLGDAAMPEVIVERRDDARGIQYLEVRLTGASADEQRVFTAAMAELLGPVTTPRFLLQVDAGGQTAVVRWLLKRAGGAGGLPRSRGARGRGHAQFLSVPAAFGLAGARIRAFADDWQREVGPCALHFVDRPESLAVLAEARRGGAVAAEIAVIERWD
ncbi:DEAD/DEAH box helicase family protein [Microbacterium sp. 2P01SA-2]|uniref:DEAD/DEAH box helicase family protein n=1 Tax=unclassified Microbacterium TaxID=2609290 RepID=UPI0039A2A9EC